MKNIKTKNIITKWWPLIKKHYKMANVSDSATVIAYYALLSLFPILIIVGSLLSLIHISAYQILNYIHPFLPNTIYHTLVPIIISSLHNSGNKLSIGLLITIWSASRIIAAFQRTTNQAYGISKPSAPFNRIMSFIWLLLSIIIIILLIFLFNFGQMILHFLNNYIRMPSFGYLIFRTLKWPMALIGLFLITNVIYYVVPMVKNKFKYTWLGSLILTVGLIVLSKGFSIYLFYFAKNISAYKTLGTFIVLMIWLYFIGMLVLFGAIFNAILWNRGKLKYKK